MRTAALAVILALASLAAAASEDVLRIDRTREVELLGTLVLAGEGATALAIASEASGRHALAGLDGTVEIVTWRAARASAPGAAPLDGFEASRMLGEAEAERFRLSGPLTLELLREPFVFVAVPEGGAVRVAGNVRAAGLPATLAREAETRAAFPLQVHTPPPTLPWAWSGGWAYAGNILDLADKPSFPAPEAPAFVLAGAVAFSIDGGTASFTDATGAARSFRLGSSVEEADPSGRARVETHRRLVFSGDAAASRIAPGGEWGIGAPRLSWDFAGMAAWRDATGRAASGGADEAFEDSTVSVRVDGVILPDAVSAGNRAQGFTATGEFGPLVVNGRAVQGGETPLAEYAPTAAAALAAAGLAGLAWKFAVAAYSRLAPRDLLAHPTRALLLDILRETGGVHKRDLQRRLGVGWGTFSFHFGALQRAGHVMETNVGGYSVVVLPGAAAPAIPHPVARALFDALPGDGAAVPVNALAARLGRSAQLLRYHAKRLERAGLVTFEGGAVRRRADPGSAAPSAAGTA